MNLNTERLLIRNFTPGDWEALSVIGRKYEESVYAKYDQGPWPASPDAYHGIVKGWSKRDDALAVVLKANQQLIGFIAFPPKQDAESTVGFGFVFHPDVHGRGYATEGCQAVIRYIFTGLHTDRIVTGTAKVNTPSCNLLRRLGFIAEGEAVTSLRWDDEGNPIKFVSVKFTLIREAWMRLKKARSRTN